MNFISVGKPNVVLNASFYLAGHLNERPLVNIRRALEGLGLESADEVTETEDHLSALCEVMRYLIERARTWRFQTLQIKGSFSMSTFALGMTSYAIQLKAFQKCISTTLSQH
ncbi:TorD/DmsD family molecular chaperone [Polynucleobacter necessarius]|uniref:TorD/DmsD family molecular chaperone n=1 Tax=Polynucleobacter necessarius TaxID=576610 RepID=UPI0018D4E6BC|nr:molecular chaperone TorD family protein [Polynucleobacter necessarius]